MAYLDAK